MRADAIVICIRKIRLGTAHNRYFCIIRPFSASPVILAIPQIVPFEVGSFVICTVCDRLLLIIKNWPLEVATKGAVAGTRITYYLPDIYTHDRGKSG